MTVRASTWRRLTNSSRYDLVLLIRYDSVCFQAGFRRRRLNLDLVFFVLTLCYMYFLLKDACLFLSYFI